MPFLFTCPQCGIRTQIPTSFIGRSGPCHSCGAMVEIQPPDEQQIKEAPASAASIGVVIAASLGILCLFVAIAGIALVIFLPSMQTTSVVRNRAISESNLKQITSALYSYHSSHGVFPPAYTVDEKGKPQHSWRSLILPFMDLNPVYIQIDFSKPWDHPANADVRDIGIWNLHCVSANIPETRTTYQVVISPQGLFYDDKPRKLSDVTDDHDQTFLVVEVPDDQAVHWMSPYDTNEQTFLNISEKSQLQHEDGFQAVMVDGSVRFFNIKEMPAERRKSMITIAGNDAFVIKK